MRWKSVLVIWVLVSAGVIAFNKYDLDDYSDDSDDDDGELAELATLSLKSDNRRQRRDDVELNSTTINEYDITEKQVNPITRTSNIPSQNPSIINLLFPPHITPVSITEAMPQLTPSPMITPTRTSSPVSHNEKPTRVNSDDKWTRSFATPTIKGQETASITTATIYEMVVTSRTYNTKVNTFDVESVETVAINQESDTQAVETTTDDQTETVMIEMNADDYDSNLLRQKKPMPPLPPNLPKPPDGNRFPGYNVKYPGLVLPPDMPEVPQNPMIPLLDLPKMLDIVKNLTANSSLNLLERFNQSLQNYSMATCPPIVTMTEPPTTMHDISKARVVAKCFVCGLSTPGIPRDADCADAFAGEFMPLVQIDSKARSHTTRYSKYCQFLDVPGFVESPLEPRSVFGRFTGGCSVRWADLTGVYTQRACRNERRPMTGKHFASKRMAKLEQALTGTQNGCIVSPMASLIPVSRGISLYARFHACVCTGQWCNKTVRTEHWTANCKIVSVFAILLVLS